MILYLVRHGVAVNPDDPQAPPDPERPLTPKGVKKTRGAALGVQAMGIKPDLLISSPYLRAAQTAEIFAEALGFAPEKIRVSDALKSSANPAEIVKELSRLKATEVMCFGHAPHVDLLIAQLLGVRSTVTEMKKAGVACFEQSASHGKWMLRWLAVPRLLRDLAD